MVREISIWVCVYFFCPPYSSLLECVPFVCLTLIPYQFPQIYGIFSSGNWLTVFITVVCSFPPHTQSTDPLFLYAGHFSATCSPKKQMKRFLIIISSFETWQSFFLFHSQVTSVTSLTGLRLENWPKRYDMCECNFFYKQWELVFWCFY